MFMSVWLDFADRDPETQRPGARDPQRPDQASFSHKNRHHEWHSGEISTGGRTDLYRILLSGVNESHVWGGEIAGTVDWHQEVRTRTNCAFKFVLRSGRRRYRGWQMNRRFMKVRECSRHIVSPHRLLLLSWWYEVFCDSLLIVLIFSTASWPSTVKTGERLFDHHFQTNRALYSVHSESERTPGAQVINTLVFKSFKSHC